MPEKGRDTRSLKISMAAWHSPPKRRVHGKRHWRRQKDHRLRMRRKCCIVNITSHYKMAGLQFNVFGIRPEFLLSEVTHVYLLSYYETPRT